MASLYNTIQELERSFDEIKRLSEAEKSAIDYYLKHGGIIKIANTRQLGIVYPSKDIIKKELSLLVPELNKVEDKLNQWNSIYKEAESFASKNRIKLYLSGTFWKHKIKEMTDKEYKEDFAKIRLPIEFVTDENMEKVISAFMNDKDYRSRLIETLDSSIVYKNRGLGEKVIKKMTLQKEIAKTKIDVLESRRNKINEEILLYKTVMKWVV